MFHLRHKDPLKKKKHTVLLKRLIIRNKLISLNITTMFGNDESERHREISGTNSSNGKKCASCLHNFFHDLIMSQVEASLQVNRRAFSS